MQAGIRELLGDVPTGDQRLGCICQTLTTLMSTPFTRYVKVSAVDVDGHLLLFIPGRMWHCSAMPPLHFCNYSALASVVQAALWYFLYSGQDLAVSDGRQQEGRHGP